MTLATRLERDSLGKIEVPEERLWGAQTARAIEHFGGFFELMPPEILHALALLKAGAAAANRDLGLLDEARASALIAAAEEVIEGRHWAEFPLSIWQSGSGTQSHMNMNEVLANRASQIMGGGLGESRAVHPNDHANLGQSTNDVFPSAMHVAAALSMMRVLLPAATTFTHALVEKARRFSDVIKVGRTHLQDATPITLGQEFLSFSGQMEIAVAAIERAQAELLNLAIGGTAVGTGLNAHPEFGSRVAAWLSARTGLPFVSAANKFAQLAGHEALVGLHGALRVLAVALNKIANDIRWMSCGPRAGLGEIHLPENEPGSSIMPGKVNPTQCESLMMICVQVMANDAAVGMAGASGNFELNVMKPLIAAEVLQSLRLLGLGMRHFTEYCLNGIEANAAYLRETVERSLMLVTALSPRLGYDAAAKIAQHAHRENITLREAAIALNALDGEEFDRLVRLEAMV